MEGFSKGYDWPNIESERGTAWDASVGVSTLAYKIPEYIIDADAISRGDPNTPVNARMLSPKYFLNSSECSLY